MDLPAAMKELEARGTAQNRKVYARHGVGPATFGVSYADLKALKKSIKRDQDLAESLWETGNHDARVLATMVADPARVSTETLDSWAADLTNYVLADALAGLAAKTPEARAIADAWIADDREWVASAGWSALASLAVGKGSGVPIEPDSFAYLRKIESEIASAPNRARHAMNGALIALGLQSPALQEAAIAAARRIGPVQVDHGETGCVTPPAEPYILKVAARNSAPKKSRARQS